MNPHAQRPTSIRALTKSLLINRNLIISLIKREISGRYRGSTLGLLWSFFNPVLMLAVYTFVFSTVFKARWPGGTGSKSEFALVLFSGLLIFNIFSECINRAPSLILANTNYVKKVLFPLEILPIVAIGSAGFHFLVNLFVWLVFYIIFYGTPPATILLLPLTLLPLIFMTLGLTWLLASLGVYLRDVGQLTGIVTTVLMFLSPIFYPISALPEQYQMYMQINPLTFFIEQAQGFMMWGKGIDWYIWTGWMIISSSIAYLGFAWFQKTRKGFADVL